MRLSVISDIHANVEAFKAVLDDMKTLHIDAVVSLGDNIGYGPEPEEVLKILQKLNIPSVMGNHELAVKDPDFIEWFNPEAKISIQKTIKMLSKNAVSYVTALPPFILKYDYRFVHGFPPDSPIIYLFQKLGQGIADEFKKLREKICFIGHTHDIMLLEFDGNFVDFFSLGKGVINLDKNKQYVINAGSVGQPRDGNNNAKYVIFDTEGFDLEIRFVPYDIASVVKKILKAGLPEEHAFRLWYG
jgi:predicted phosphodiesterase